MFYSAKIRTISETSKKMLKNFVLREYQLRSATMSASDTTIYSNPQNARILGIVFTQGSGVSLEVVLK